MDKAAFDEYKEKRYEEQIKYYSAKNRENRDKYRQFQWILIILSALTPVFAALNGYTFGQGEDAFHLDLTIVVVVISAIVAILTTGLKTFNYQELWVTYRNTLEELKREIYYYNFNVGPYSEPGIDKESLFVTKVEAILDKEHTQWPIGKKFQEEQSKEKAPESPALQIQQDRGNPPSAVD